MKKTGQIIIYKAKKKVQPIHKDYFTIPKKYLVGFLLVLGLFSVFSSYFLLTRRTIQQKPRLLSAQIVNLPHVKQGNHIPMLSFSVLSSAVASVSPTPTPTPEKKSLAEISVPKAQAQTTEGGYCLHVPILMYHHVQPLDMASKLGHAPLTVDSKYFDEQMAYLVSGGYHAITADELIAALLHHTGLPEKSVMVTLDDGYDDMYTFAYPILQKYHVVGNFMIPTGLMGVQGYLTWDELKDMVKSPYVRIYNHTWSHADLVHSSREKIDSEITMSQNQLESNLGVNTNIFTYPYGYFNDEVKGVLKEHGFIAAFSTIGGVEQCESQIMELRRLHMGNAPLQGYGF